MVERERERRKAMAKWESNWKEKNAAQTKLLREQRELENRKELEFQEGEKQILAERRRQEEMELEQIQVIL